jgi:sulfofructose kinase
VGDDELADQFEVALRAEGVDPSGLHRVPGAVSTLSTVLVDAHGERLIVSRRTDALSEPAPPVFGGLQGCEVLLVDPRCVTWAEAALKQARAAGVRSVLDGELSPPGDLQRLVPWADWVVFSEGGLVAWSRSCSVEAASAQVAQWAAAGPTSSAAAAGPLREGPSQSQRLCERFEAALLQAVQAGPEVAVVTLGGAGLVWLSKAEAVARHLPAHRVAQVLDTLGAGDTFHGALGVALAEGQTPQAALRWASVAAALKCQHRGGVQGAPRRAEVLAALAAD